jgi:hypothetical protein
MRSRARRHFEQTKSKIKDRMIKGEHKEMTAEELEILHRYGDRS